MLNISIVQITVIGVIVAASILVGRWLGRKSNPKIKEPGGVSAAEGEVFHISEGSGHNDFHASLFRNGLAAGVVVCRTYRRSDSFIGIG